MQKDPAIGRSSNEALSGRTGRDVWLGLLRCGVSLDLWLRAVATGCDKVELPAKQQEQRHRLSRRSYWFQLAFLDLGSVGWRGYYFDLAIWNDAFDDSGLM
jgi:hypothetical protein